MIRVVDGRFDKRQVWLSWQWRETYGYDTCRGRRNVREGNIKVGPLKQFCSYVTGKEVQ